MASLTAHDIIDRVNGISDTGRVGMAATNLMEESDNFGGPYSPETRDWIERYLSDNCSINRINRAGQYAIERQGMEELLALSTDDGENLLDDDGQITEVYSQIGA